MILIEGADKFIDPETGKEANIAFWLPEFFPKNVKVICSVSDPSDSLEYLDKKGCQIVSISTTKTLAEKLLTEAMSIPTIFDSQT